MDAPHSLALKVMRLSRPSLAQTQAPWISPSIEQDDFQHLVLSTYDADPNRLNGALHPSPLPCSLEHAVLSPLLTLPAAFGTICLGETFAATLNLSNETTATVSDATITVEMQSQSAKQLIEEKHAIGPGHALEGEHAMELGVEWEIKELGMHVLVCTVHYGTGLEARSFQKFYKFNVSPPLNIKTRVHLLTAPNGRMASTDKENVYLEVHVQNTSPSPVTFERIVLEPSAGLHCQSIEAPLPTENWTEPGFEGPFHSLMPRDTRQYLFVLSPSALPSPTPTPNPVPGAILPLGRLDITWRSTPFAERGRLLTSTLNRRVPAMPTTSPQGVKPSSPSSPSRAINDSGRSSPLPPPVPPKSRGNEPSSCEICVAQYPRVAMSIEDHLELPVIIKLRRKKLSQRDYLTTIGVQHVPVRPIAKMRHPQPPSIAITTHDQLTPHPGPKSSLASSSRPFSPSAGLVSRPLTPVTSQLRQATTSAISSTAGATVVVLPPGVSDRFPPPADLKTSTRETAGDLRLKGASLMIVELSDYTDAKIADDNEDWEEAVAEVRLNFVAWSSGLGQLGGLRVLESVDDNLSEGSLVTETENLGSIWIHA